MAGTISDDLKERIRAASPIVDVISSYLGPLKKAGGSWVALCPFHKEKTPSFHVNPTRQSFHCFGCNEGGDIFTFVQLYENVPFVEALKRLGERASIPVEFDNDPRASEKRHEKEVLFDIHEKITRRWQSALTNEACGQIARDYLERRGVSFESIERFRLGYAPNEWDDSVNWANGNSFPLEMMEKGGLVIKRDRGEGYYDRFRGRLMFPIADEQGRIVGFSGRILNDEEKTAKYVNSPETPLFTKGRIIYGLDKARRKIADAGFSIVCEGQLDLIRCHVSGVENVIAPQGTALTSDHGRILKRYADEVVLCFDSDAAGQKAAVRSLEALAPSGLSVRVLLLPPPHDPDSFIRELGVEAFEKSITDAPEYFQFLLDRSAATHDEHSDRGRRAILTEMNGALTIANDEVLRDTWTRKVAARLGVSTEAVSAEFRKLVRGSYRRPSRRDEYIPEPTEEPVQVEEHIPDQEKWLLRHFFELSASQAVCLARTNLTWISSPTVRQLLDVHLAGLADHSWDGAAPLSSSFENPDSRRVLSSILAEQRNIPNPEEQYLDILRRLRDRYTDYRIGQISQRLKRDDASADEMRAMWEEINELKKQKLLPLS